MGLAVVHVIGALGASFACGVLVLFIAAREQEQLQKRRLQDASIALRVAVAALDSDESLVPRLLQYSFQRFSAELPRNRLSDLSHSLSVVGTLSHAVRVVALGEILPRDELTQRTRSCMRRGAACGVSPCS